MKKISTLTGIIIIVAVAVILFGGVFAWQYFTKFQIPIPNTQPNSNTQNPVDQSIRNSDLSKFMIESSLLHKAFGEEVNTPQYADLNNDGREEAVFTIFSGGTSGSFGPFVVKLENNKLVQVKIEKDPLIPENMGLNLGHISFFITKNKLIKEFPLYKSGDANCCPTGGTMYISYKWENSTSQLLVDKTSKLSSDF